MAQLIRCRVGLFSVQFAKGAGPCIYVPSTYSRLCFHTSVILDVKGKEVRMPSLSPTMETGTIVKWLKKEGDEIQPGDAIADIQTDKAVMGLEYDDESIMAKIIVPEGTKDVKIGELIALTVERGEDWKAVEMPSGAAAAAPSQPSPSTPAAPAPVSPAGASGPPPPGQQNIPMPSLSPTMVTGTIIKWYKKEGDKIQPGDAIADIQTDKAVMTFEIEEEGVFAKILSPEGSQVEVGKMIAITVEEGMDISKVVVPAATTSTPAAPAAAPKPSSAKPPAAAPMKLPPASGQVYGLAVKRLLEEYGLSSGSIKGTGRPNRLLKGDVLAYIQSQNLHKVDLKSAVPSTPSKTAQMTTETSHSAAPSRYVGGPSTFTDVPVSNIRGVIAKRLSESKSNIPHSYATIDIKMDKVNEIRSKLQAENVKVSVNDFIIKAVAHALSECPDINSLYQNGQITHVPNVDISVAVAAPTGLITPIVFNAISKSLGEISNDVKTLAGKARDGKLKPNEFQGGSFTISNLGMFGIKQFSAIINPPQTAILAVGTGRKVLASTMDTNTEMLVTLSYDRRAIDEEQAADFLSVLQAVLEEPSFLAVGKAHRHQRHHE